MVATEAAGEGEAAAVPGGSGGGNVWENSSRPVMNLLVRGLAEAAAYEELVRERVSVGGSIRVLLTSGTWGLSESKRVW